MMNFVTLNTLCSDILYLGRGSKVVSSETLTMKQIECWVHQYRALLIKQDLDKNRWPDEGYIQEIAALRLIPVDRAGELSKVASGKYTYKTELQIPKAINLANKDGILYIGTLEGDEIQFVSESRANWQIYKKYTDKEALAYIKNQYVYVVTELPLEYISIRGIFEVPTEVINFDNSYANITEHAIDNPYPIPINVIPTLKELILKKELNVILETPSDNTNDAQNKVESNIENSRGLYMYFGRGKNKITDVISYKDIYKAYKTTVDKETPYDVTSTVFNSIIKEYYAQVALDLLEGNSVKLPSGIGPIVVRKKKVKGSLPIDWVNSSKYGKLCFNFNEHTSGWKYFFLWGLDKAKVTFINYYRFKPARGLARALAAKINNERYDYFEK